MPTYKREPDERFSIYLDNGQEVKVDWLKDFTKIKGVEFATDHLEFRGPMTSTGYWSHFVNKGYGEQIDRDIMIDHARAIAQARWEENNKGRNKEQVALL